MLHRDTFHHCACLASGELRFAGFVIVIVVSRVENSRFTMDAAQQKLTFSTNGVIVYVMLDAHLSR